MDHHEKLIPKIPDPSIPVVNNLTDLQGVPNPTTKTSHSLEDFMLYVPSVGYVPRQGVPGIFYPEDYETYFAR